MLQEEEAAELCDLDGLIGFGSTSSYSLSMAELLFDQAIRMDTDIPENSKKDEKALLRCQRHLSRCLECTLLHIPSVRDALPPPDATFLARLYWALGKLQLMEERCHEAEKSFEKAYMHAAKLEGPLHLGHLQTDFTISVETIQSKLVTCLYHDMIDTLPAEDESPTVMQYEDMCTLLFPVLFHQQDSTKPPILLEDYRFRGLCFLRVRVGLDIYDC